MSETAIGWIFPMKAKYHLKRVIGCAAWAGLTALLFAQSSFGQGFISREYRDRWYQEYENFGGYDIRRNPTYPTESYKINRGSTEESAMRTQTMRVLSRATYDQFGNFLLPGGTIYNMKWDRSRLGSDYDFDGTYSYNVFNNLMVSADEFSNWQTRFMISNVYSRDTTSDTDVTQGTTAAAVYIPGSGMRAYFTPSTLKLTNFDGVRWDASSRKNNVTLLVQNNSGMDATNLYGVHWESILGDILKVGGTFVSRQRGTSSYSNSDIDHTESGIIGMKSEPRYIYLVLTDDSPEDRTNGPRIYDVKVIANNEDITSNVPKRVFKINDLLNARRFISGSNEDTPYIFQSASSSYFPITVDDNLATSGSWFLNAMDFENSSSAKFENLFAKSSASGYSGLINVASPTNSSERYYAADTSSGYLEANGTDVVIYEFLVPSGTRDLKFDVLAANDYNLDIIAALYRSTVTDEGNWDDQPLTSAWNGKWSVIYDSRNVAKANGNVKDLSNTKWVTVQYERVTGMNVYGLNAELNWRGLYINGEINEYNVISAYPLNENLSGGSRSKKSMRAWFVNIEKDFGAWSFGGELYKYPRDYMRYFATIDNNNDNDAYVHNEEPDGIDADAPGYDNDWDRISDLTFKNKPYLTYYFDDVVFGDDFNHDGTIDIRENDEAIDLPYEQNSKGQHFFMKMKPREKTLFTLGYYDIKQESLDGRNQTEYFKAEHFQPLGTLGEITIQHRSELIKYNSFRTYRYGSYGTYTLNNRLDTFSNTTLFHTKIRPVENLNIINDVLTKWEKDYGPIVLSAYDTIIEHTMKQVPIKKNRQYLSGSFVHKADYTINIADRRLFPDLYIGGYRIMKEKRIKELKFQPMIKFENSYEQEFNLRLSRFFMLHKYKMYPVIRFDYTVAPNTKLRCGFQGLPGFEERFRIGKVKTYTEYALEEYDMRRMIIAFENRTLYQGFNLVVLLGMSKEKTTYVDSRGRQEPGNTQYFVTVQSESIR